LTRWHRQRSAVELGRRHAMAIAPGSVRRESGRAGQDRAANQSSRATGTEQHLRDTEPRACGAERRCSWSAISGCGPRQAHGNRGADSQSASRRDSSRRVFSTLPSKTVAGQPRNDGRAPLTEPTGQEACPLMFGNLLATGPTSSGLALGRAARFLPFLDAWLLLDHVGRKPSGISGSLAFCSGVSGRTSAG